MKTILLSILLVSASINAANAGFQRWSVTTKKNPFSGGVDVSVLYLISKAAQIQVHCDSGKQGIRIVAIPGFEASADALTISPIVRFAVDGEIMLSDVSARVSTFGANLAGVVIELTKENADIFTDGLVNAKRQIALEDGISSKPFLLSARGSTAAARKIKQCYHAQKGTTSDPIADDDASKVERIAEIESAIEQLMKELKELKR